MKKRHAFTYMELAMVAVIVAIVTVIAVSDGDSEGDEQGRFAADRFASDVSYARSCCLARPDDPVVLKVDVDANKYWLARAADEDTPIAHPKTGKPYVVTFGPDGDRGFDHVALNGQDFGGDSVLRFTSVGGIDQADDAILQIAVKGVEYEMTVGSIAAKTGVVKGWSSDLGGGELGGGGKGGLDLETPVDQKKGTVGGTVELK
jgi:hypothetical protein